MFNRKTLIQKYALDHEFAWIGNEAYPCGELIVRSTLTLKERWGYCTIQFVMERPVINKTVIANLRLTQEATRLVRKATTFTGTLIHIIYLTDSVVAIGNPQTKECVTAKRLSWQE